MICGKAILWLQNQGSTNRPFYATTSRQIPKFKINQRIHPQIKKVHYFNGFRYFSIASSSPYFFIFRPHLHQEPDKGEFCDAILFRQDLIGYEGGEVNTALQEDAYQFILFAALEAIAFFQEGLIKKGLEVSFKR